MHFKPHREFTRFIELVRPFPEYLSCCTIGLKANQLCVFVGQHASLTDNQNPTKQKTTETIPASTNTYVTILQIELDTELKFSIIGCMFQIRGLLENRFVDCYRTKTKRFSSNGERTLVIIFHE